MSAEPTPPPVEPPAKNLTDRLHDDSDGDLFDIFLSWTVDRGFELYEAQEEAILEIFADRHVILNTPTGSGKSLVALAMHFFSFARGMRSYYTSPIKALVSEKFFALCEHFGAENVGMLTGDASINHDAPIICCTQEILAATALNEGEDADIQHAVIDEFHYYADRDRGTAWQLPLLMLPDTAFLLMSATLGRTKHLEKQLEERTDRKVALVSSDTRPVPLSFEYSLDKTVHLAEDLVKNGKAPVYIVCFTQRDCAELVQSLMSVNYCTDEEKDAIKEALQGTSFDTPYGDKVRRYLRHGIAIHHGGLLPKYRFITEKLAQKGHLKIIVGTDTLGVGINMPLRTVVFTRLCKYDGEKTRLLSVREFKQIAGRAGRKGFDDKGYVIAQAPEHVIENEAAIAKAKGNPKKMKKIVKSTPPDFNYVHWDEETFERLHTSDSEELESRFTIDHSTLLYLLQRPKGAEHGYRDLLELIDLSHESDAKKEMLRDKARMLLRTLEQAEIISLEPSEDGDEQKIVLNADLQRDFSIHHSLSLFLVEVIRDLDVEHADFHFTVLSFVEAILEDPYAVLKRQRDKERDKEYKRLKAEGVDYDELREKLDKVTHPKPDAEIIEATFEAFSQHNPWVTGFEPSPKSVARDMFERYASFNQYVKQYGLERSEGVLLRYLNQVYKALRQNVPRAAKTDLLHDVIAYLREVIARADSSLVEEWESLRDDILDADLDVDLPDEEEEEPLDADLPAFAARVHAELMQIVGELADDNLEEAAALVRPNGMGWNPITMEEALEPFYEEYDHIVFNHDARNKKLMRLERESPGVWSVTQVICDDVGDNMWYMRGAIDLDEINSPNDRLFALEYLGD